jgi:hypothetical protein
MAISARRMAALREHIQAESAHDIEALIGGMTPDCFNDARPGSRCLMSSGSGRRTISFGCGRTLNFRHCLLMICTAG